MAAETLKADVNEILLGYHLLGGKWTGFQDAGRTKTALGGRLSQIGQLAYDIQDDRAKAMSMRVLSWAAKNNFNRVGVPVAKVWWTARPGVLSKAYGKSVDSRKNPTDTLVQFKNGKFLGLSAKSTAGKGDIGFKNPGVGTIDKALGIKLKKIIDKQEELFIEEFELSSTASSRKVEIRASQELIEAANEARDETLKKVRNSFYNKLRKLRPKILKAYVLSDWMDATNTNAPYYIKVTGHGSKPPFTATIVDPLNNTKMEVIMKTDLKVVKVGNDSIGVEAIAKGGQSISAANKRILKMRVKYESQAMASSVKFSGDPW